MGFEQHFLVVGGTRGIGKVLVGRLSALGHTVSVLTRNPSATERFDNVSYFQTDVADTDALLTVCSEIVKLRGKFDHLICLQRYRDKDDPWIGEFAVSVTSNKVLIDFFSDNCTRNNNNTVVIASSIASSHVVDTQPLCYHTAKAAIDQIIRYYAVKLGPIGIRVNGISPATILKHESQHYFLDNGSLHELYKEITPLKRMGTAAEVVNVIEFLFGSGSSFVTGQTLIIDGGLSLQWQESLSLRIYNNLKQQE